MVMLWSLKFYVKKTACLKMWKGPNWIKRLFWNDLMTVLKTAPGYKFSILLRMS